MQARAHLQVFILTVDIVLLVSREALRKLLEGHVVVVLFDELELGVLPQQVDIIWILQDLRQIQRVSQVREPVQADNLQGWELVKYARQVLQPVLIQVQLLESI